MAGLPGRSLEYEEREFLRIKTGARGVSFVTSQKIKPRPLRDSIAAAGSYRPAVYSASHERIFQPVLWFLESLAVVEFSPYRPLI